MLSRKEDVNVSSSDIQGLEASSCPYTPSYALDLHIGQGEIQQDKRQELVMWLLRVSLFLFRAPSALAQALTSGVHILSPCAYFHPNYYRNHRRTASPL
jgi:hypothetical protein